MTSQGFSGGSAGKKRNLPANAGDAKDGGLIPGSRRSLEKQVASHSSVLAWEIYGHPLQCSSQGDLWTEPVRVLSMGSQELDANEHSGAGVQPRWIQGDSKVGGRSRRLWKNTYLITDIERLEMDSVVGRLVEKRRLNNLDYVE